MFSVRYWLKCFLWGTGCGIYTTALKKSGVYCFNHVCPSVRPSHECFSSHLSQELHYKDFWNFVAGYICASFTVWCFFRFTTQLLPIYRTLNHFTYDIKVENFRHNFLRNYNTGFLKFGFRDYIGQPYWVMRFQIHHSTTSCLPSSYWAGVSSMNSSSQFYLLLLCRSTDQWKVTCDTFVSHSLWYFSNWYQLCFC